METLPAGYRDRNPYPSRPARRRHHVWRRVLAVVLALAVLCAGFLAVSAVGAWRSPGNQNFQAKWADWLRSHHAGLVASGVEQFYYDHNAPAKGGRPRSLNSVPAVTGRRSVAARVGLPPPAPVPLVVEPALAGEGVWAPVGGLVQGVPGMYEAQFRADNVYTSQITSAVWIDPTLLHVALVPGSQEPGGTWPEPPDIAGPALATVEAAFNGGFRMQDAHGGFYLNGRTQVPLVSGAASMVIYRDGHIDIGAWQTEISMSSSVVAVLQNLVPIVDRGQPAPDASYSDTKIWGSTLGASTVVARSGIGVTADGALVYVAGPALTARSLAESLQRVGAVRAMTLDINPEWVTFNFFNHPNPADPSEIVPTKLYPRMQRSAYRYIGPTRESRDFFTISAPAPV
jgi:hypothetical protein